MLTAVTAALPLALGLLLAALPVTIIPIALAAKRPPAVARSFLGGWLVGVLLVGGLVIAFVDVLVLPSGNSRWAAWTKIVLGLLLVLLAVKRWADRNEDADGEGALGGIETMGAGRAFGLALLLATVNPKNLVIVIAGATSIAEASPVPTQQVVALIAFAVVGSLGVAAPVMLAVVLGDRADVVLAAVDRWMTRNGRAIVALVLLILGVVLAANGLTALNS